jgi:hypothetical protein
MTAAAEDKAKRLAKLKSSTICPNCGTEKKFGFGFGLQSSFTSLVSHEMHVESSSHLLIVASRLPCRLGRTRKSLNWNVQAMTLLSSNMAEDAPPSGRNGRPQPGSDMAILQAICC